MVRKVKKAIDFHKEMRLVFGDPVMHGVVFRALVLNTTHSVDYATALF